MISIQTTPTRQQLVLPLATLVPVSAIVFAFSLGPSPEKRLDGFYGSSSDEQAADFLSSLGPRVVPQVATNLLRSELPRRSVSIEFLGAQGGEDARFALRSVVEREDEPTKIRALALRALHNVVALEAEELAMTYRDRSDALGESARKIVPDATGWLSKNRMDSNLPVTLGHP